jgi:hypothetical protein
MEEELQPLSVFYPIHEWEPDFSDGEPPLDSKTCGICGREDDLYHFPKETKVDQ